MARVSFAAVKRVGIALGWIVLFVAIGIGITIALSELLPGWGGNVWFLFRNGMYEVAGVLLPADGLGRLRHKKSLGGKGGGPPPPPRAPRVLPGGGVWAPLGAL